ncbi:MAG: DUF2752 domain-containing protein [Muribaculaceae bacterium]|nr:DUF2752 domain-containing protein [Muribaculaceae bacterium]
MWRPDRNLLIKALIPVVLVAIIVALYFFNPMEAVWMPKCGFKMLTGLDCPSCGALRAGHAFLHGRFTEAVNYNLFLVIGVPYLTAVFVATQVKGNSGSMVRRIFLGREAAWVYIVLFFTWWILRNCL